MLGGMRCSGVQYPTVVSPQSVLQAVYYLGLERIPDMQPLRHTM